MDVNDSSDKGWARFLPMTVLFAFLSVMVLASCSDTSSPQPSAPQPPVSSPPTVITSTEASPSSPPASRPPSVSAAPATPAKPATRSSSKPSASSTSLGHINDAVPSTITLDTTKNSDGQYVVKPGQHVMVSVGLINTGPDDTIAQTLIVAELTCSDAEASTLTVRTKKARVDVPGTDGGSADVTKTWTGSLTVPPRCRSLKIGAVADGTIDALVGPDSNAGGGASAAIKLTK